MPKKSFKQKARNAARHTLTAGEYALVLSVIGLNVLYGVWAAMDAAKNPNKHVDLHLHNDTSAPLLNLHYENNNAHTNLTDVVSNLASNVTSNVAEALSNTTLSLNNTGEIIANSTHAILRSINDTILNPSNINQANINQTAVAFDQTQAGDATRSALHLFSAFLIAVLAFRILHDRRQFAKLRRGDVIEMTDREEEERKLFPEGTAEFRQETPYHRGKMDLQNRPHEVSLHEGTFSGIHVDRHSPPIQHVHLNTSGKEQPSTRIGYDPNNPFYEKESQQRYSRPVSTTTSTTSTTSSTSTNPFERAPSRLAPNAPLFQEPYSTHEHKPREERQAEKDAQTKNLTTAEYTGHSLYENMTSHKS